MNNYDDCKLIGGGIVDRILPHPDTEGTYLVKAHFEYMHPSGKILKRRFMVSFTRADGVPEDVETMIINNMIARMTPESV